MNVPSSFVENWRRRIEVEPIGVVYTELSSGASGGKGRMDMDVKDE